MKGGIPPLGELSREAYAWKVPVIDQRKYPRAGVQTTCVSFGRYHGAVASLLLPKTPMVGISTSSFHGKGKPRCRAAGAVGAGDFPFLPQLRPHLEFICYVRPFVQRRPAKNAAFNEMNLLGQRGIWQSVFANGRSRAFE